MKQRLFTPGPTPVPERVSLKMATPIIHHRNPEFAKILTHVHEGLKYLFKTTQPVVVLACSGTGGMESTMVSLFSRGDKIVSINGGKFGARWTEMAQMYTGNVIEIKTEWGDDIDSETIKKTLQAHPDTKGIYLTYSETSTGTSLDLCHLSTIMKENSDAFICVDGVTAIGAQEFWFDKWDIDVCVTGSQKGLMMPPGLAMVALSKRAITAIKNAKLPSYYFNLKKALNAYEKNDTPFTPAVSLVIGLEESLTMIKNEGIENTWARHLKLSQACRLGCQALGMKLFSQHPSLAVTAVWLPEGIEWKSFNHALKIKNGITVAAGQDDYKGKIFRISHLGFYDELDMLTVIGAIELSLKDRAYPFTMGAGVSSVLHSISS